jgi:alpha-beta hydrolase superfamily lysophospholipase
MTGKQDDTDPSSSLDDPRILKHVFYPRRVERQPIETAEVGKNNFRRITISFQVDENVRIEGLGYLAGSSAPNLLFFHGNGETAYDYEDIGPLFAHIGINFFVTDYRGYGTSGGSPTFSGMMRDAEKIFKKLIDLLNERGLTGYIFVMGRSLGSAPALELCRKFPDRIRGLIIESGFAHTHKLLIALGVDSRLLRPEEEAYVSNLEKMKKVSLPVLVIHGEEDEVIPLSDGLDLYSVAATEDKELLLVPNAGHNTLLFYGLKEYLKAINNFIHRLSSPFPSSPSP